MTKFSFKIFGSFSKCSYIYCAVYVLLLLDPVKCSPVKNNLEESTIHQDGIVIEEMLIQSNITFRYAKTCVKLFIVNRNNKTFGEVRLAIIISPSAREDSGGFISRAGLFVDKRWYKASIKPIDQARTSDNSDTHGATKESRSGLTIRSKDGYLSQFELIAKVGPSKKANVTLIYEELTYLKTYETYSRYEHKISAKPEKMENVKKFRVELNVEEQDKPNNTRIYIRNTHPPEFSKRTKEDNRHNNVSLFWSPNGAELATLKSKSVLGELTVMFDLPLDSSDKEVLARNGYFTHFTANETFGNNQDAPIVPIHAVFVLDVSASMKTRRLQQLKDGMNTILKDMKNEDYIDIITFSNEIKQWDPIPPNKSPFPADIYHKNSAREFINNLVAYGSTNIFSALSHAFDTIKTVRDKKNWDFSSIIFFLTDGRATVGLTDRSKILTRIQGLNEELKVPIFSLAFGSEADRQLCNKISEENHGFAREIFDMRNASLLMKGFYHDIITLITKNITTRNYQHESENRKEDAVADPNIFTILLNKSNSDVNEISKERQQKFDHGQVGAVVFDVGQCDYYRKYKNQFHDSELDKMNQLIQLCDKDSTVKKIHTGSLFQQNLFAFLETRELAKYFQKERLKCPEKLGTYYGDPETLPINLTRMALHHKFVTPCTFLSA